MKEYCCIRCNEEFDDQISRNIHQGECKSILFLNRPIELPGTVLPSPKYKEILKKASEKYPCYRRYIGRRHPSEPNNLSFLYLGSKGKHEEKNSKKADDL